MVYYRSRSKAKKIGLKFTHVNLFQQLRFDELNELSKVHSSLADLWPRRNQNVRFLSEAPPDGTKKRYTFLMMFGQTQGGREAKLQPSFLSSCVLHRLTPNLHWATRLSIGIHIASAILYSDSRTKLRSGISSPFLPGSDQMSSNVQ